MLLAVSFLIIFSAQLNEKSWLLVDVGFVLEDEDRTSCSARNKASWLSEDRLGMESTESAERDDDLLGTMGSEDDRSSMVGNGAGKQSIDNDSHRSACLCWDDGLPSNEDF